MQSYRKQSGSYFGRQQPNSSFNIHQKPSNAKRKSSVAIQTENLPNIGNLCDFGLMSMEEIKEQYRSTLQFLNHCHDYMNSMFGEDFLSVGDSNARKPFQFRVPTVPNYFSVLDIFLEQSKTPNEVAEMSSKSHNVLDNEQQSLPQNTGDGPDPAKNMHFRGDFDPFNSLVNVDAASCVFEENYKRPISPSRLVRSEKDILRKPSHHNLKALSNTFEEIFKTCNEFEHRSIEYLLKNDVPLEQPAGKTKPSETTNQEVPSSTSKGFNLLEYALRNCKSSSNSPPATPNKGLLADNLSKILVNFQGIVTSTKKSLTILNQAPQCQSPKRVNELFEKISTDNLRSSEYDVDDSEDSEEFKRFVEDEEKSCEAELASSDSVILTDEEFLRRNRKSVEAWNPDEEEARRNEEDQFRDERLDAGTSVKFNPLKLNAKDKSLTDEKVLRTIGLFTDKGDIRPGVMSILEEKRRANLTRNRAKNVQFRTERKFDLQVRFNNNNMKLNDNTSEESVSDNGELPRLPPRRSSSVSISTCSTISDSDIILNTAINKND